MRRSAWAAVLAVGLTAVCAVPMSAYGAETGGALEEAVAQRGADEAVEPVSTTASASIAVAADASEGNGAAGDDGAVDGTPDADDPEPPTAPSFRNEWGQVDGVWRYYDAAGEPIAVASPGWILIQGKYQFVDEAGKPVSSQWVLDDGSWYWLDAKGNMATGWYQVGDTWYYSSASGRMQTGWINPYDDAWYLMRQSGAMDEGWAQVDGKWYWLAPGSGRMATGWRLIDGEWNWFDGSGAWHPNSWVRQGGRWWYRWADGGYPTTGSGLQKIDGHYYAFDDSGWMRTGWYYDAARGSWLYLDPVVGNAVTGWRFIGDEWFYLDDECEWVPNSWEYRDGTYYLRWATGGLATGWTKMDGDWYLMASDGAMLTGWQPDNGRWYYLRDSGRMATGWVDLDGTWYYLNPGGSMHTGWLFWGGDWYFMDKSGAWNDEDPEMTAYAQGFTSNTDWLILIDTKNNQLGIFRGSYGNWDCVRLWRCSCGAAWTPTPLGTYSVTGRGYSFGSSTYTCYYYTQFYGDYLIHSVIYFRNGAVEDALGKGLSQGCVRLEINNAKWVYDNVPNGTKVYNY